MHAQTSNINELIKKFKGTKLEENNNIAAMFAQCLQIFKLLI